MTDPKTKLVQSQIGTDPAHGSVPPPLYMSSTYLWPNPSEKGEYDYGRTNNPNRDGLAQTLAELDGGAGAVITSSGMSAIDLTLNLMNAGDLILAPHDCYGGTHRLFTHRHQQGRIKVEFVDQSDEIALKHALAKGPKLVFIESPSNPLMRVVDVQKICKAAKTAGALTIVDNTFLTALRLRPLDLGADITVQSTTKYINGHSDIIGGCVVAKSADHAETLAWWANCAGLRTLSLRLEAAEANAVAIAEFLQDQPGVKAVYSPALSAHPQAAIIKAQQSGPGPMLSFEVETLDAATKFCRALKIFKLAASLGGVESLICLPETMTHRGMEESARRLAGISEGLLRLSVGIEAKSDLIADLAKGFSCL